MRQLTVQKMGFILVSIAIILRVVIGQNLLNQYVGYTSGTGFIGGRFHPATYLLLFTIVFHAFCSAMIPTALKKRGTHYLMAIALAVVSVAIALSNGGFNGAAIVVDVIIMPILLAYLVRQFTDQQRETIFKLLLFLLAFNLLPVLFERVTGTALIPREKNTIENFFRPQGYLDHPLCAGSVAFCMMWAILRRGTSPTTDLMWSGALLLQIMMLGVRLPLVVGAALFLFQILKLGRNSPTGKLTAGFLLMTVPPILLAVGTVMGWFDRFLNLGIYDEKSAGSRFNSFKLLAGMTPSQFWGGMGSSSIENLYLQTGTAVIENSFVMYTVIAGAIVAYLVTISLIISINGILRRDALFLGITAAMALGTIMFSSKTCAVAVYLLLAELVSPRLNYGRIPGTVAISRRARLANGQ